MNSTEFDTYFNGIYKERWLNLKKALKSTPQQIARITKWSAPSDSERNSLGLLSQYILDPASIVVARGFLINPDSSILDMCSAPGGKLMILLESLGPEGKAIAYELSESRRQQLIKNIRQYIPEEIRKSTFVRKGDSAKVLLQEKNYFDAVLLDAPCSGERYQINSQGEAPTWTEKISDRLSDRQQSLLWVAINAAKPKGNIIYSTCSISPLENDTVVKKVMDRCQKKKLQVKLNLEINSFQQDIISKYNLKVEPKEFGFSILPDLSNGAGPMYWSQLQRI